MLFLCLVRNVNIFSFADKFCALIASLKFKRDREYNWLKSETIFIKLWVQCLAIGTFTKISTRNHIQIMLQIVALIGKNLYYTEF